MILTPWWKDLQKEKSLAGMNEHVGARDMLSKMVSRREPVFVRGRGQSRKGQPMIFLQVVEKMPSRESRMLFQRKKSMLRNLHKLRESMRSRVGSCSILIGEV